MIHVPPLTRVPPPRRHLARDEKAAWRALAPKLVAARVLTVLDTMALEHLCCAWCDYRRRLQMAKELPTRYRRRWARSGESGRRIARGLATEFFLIPDERVRIGPVDRATGIDLELQRIFDPEIPLRLYRGSRRRPCP